MTTVMLWFADAMITPPTSTSTVKELPYGHAHLRGWLLVIIRRRRVGCIWDLGRKTCLQPYANKASK